MGKPRDWQFIVVHHTATHSGDVGSIDVSHKKKKDGSGKPWLGIGYHFVIGNGSGMDDGEIEPTFRWKEQLHGAHAGAEDPEYNQRGIGVCLVGNFEEKAPSPSQMLAVKRLVTTLKREYKISSKNVVAHNEVRKGGTECPGKYFPMKEVAGEDFSLPLSESPTERTFPPLAERPGSILK